MPKVEIAPDCRECGHTFSLREGFHICACCGDFPLCRTCEDEHQCSKKGCRRCGAAVISSAELEGPWCSPCRAEVAGGIDIDLDQGGPVKRLEHGVYGPRAEDLGIQAWLDEAADDLEGLAAKCRAAAVALSNADAPRAMALALMGESLPAKWNGTKEAVEVRGLDPTAARQLAIDHGWILKGPGFTPGEWEDYRKKDAEAARSESLR